MGIHANDPRSFQDLDASERSILAAASRIFAAWLQGGKISDDNADAAMDKAIDLAIRLADKVDERIQGDTEL